nr:MAG TPA: hypothetical protein [Caudoviricetes sp.]
MSPNPLFWYLPLSFNASFTLSHSFSPCFIICYLVQNVYCFY